MYRHNSLTWQEGDAVSNLPTQEQLTLESPVQIRASYATRQCVSSPITHWASHVQCDLETPCAKSAQSMSCLCSSPCAYQTTVNWSTTDVWTIGTAYIGIFGSINMISNNSKSSSKTSRNNSSSAVSIGAATPPALAQQC